MKVEARSIKRPGLLGLLAAMSAIAAVAACFSLFSLAGSDAWAAGKTISAAEKPPNQAESL